MPYVILALWIVAVIATPFILRYEKKRRKPARLPANNRYDLETLEGIQAIQIPRYSSIVGIASPTNNIEYILQRKAAEHKKNGRMDLAIACLRKSNEIMPYSNFTWSASDYMRLVRYLHDDGQIVKAEQEEERLQRNLPQVFDRKGRIESGNKYRVSQAKSAGYDLVQLTEHYPTCAECSKFQGRVYSESGRDKRFPSLSVAFDNRGVIHDGCKHIATPWIEELHTPREIREAIAFSNRPFIDSRGTVERETWQRQRDDEISYEKDHALYKKIVDAVGADRAPKSFSGFKRMRSSNSVNWQKLVALARDNGIDIETED